MAIRLAGTNDKEAIVNISAEAFKQYEYFLWLFKESKKEKKLKVLSEFIFDETIKTGKIYLNGEGTAYAMWTSGKKEPLSVEVILRSFTFLFRIGILTVIRLLVMQQKIYKHYPKKQAYFRLHQIGVHPEAQRKGFANELLTPVLKEKEEQNIPVYLETARKINVEIYKKKGFEMISTEKHGPCELYIMKK